MDGQKRVKRFGLSGAQIEFLFRANNEGGAWPERQATADKILALGLVKKVDTKDAKEKAEYNRQIERLRVRAIRLLQKGEIKLAYNVLDDAMMDVFSRDDQTYITTATGAAMCARLVKANGEDAYYG